MAVTQFNLADKQRAERKLLITVAEWQSQNGELYSVTVAKPGDWASNYTNYYTKNEDTYTAVTGETAPTWQANTYYARVDREVLGRRTEDSSIEYNADIETSTDVLGINYTDVNRTQPQQTFDPYLILGGSKLGAKLNDIRRRNALSELNQFTLYVITAYAGTAGQYEAECHDNCTIAYTALGGDSNVNMPIDVYFSNNYNDTGAPGLGTVDKLSDDFTFTPATQG